MQLARFALITVVVRTTAVPTVGAPHLAARRNEARTGGSMSDLAPLEAAAPAIAASSDLARRLKRPYLTDEWRPQLQNLMGLAMRIPQGSLVDGGEVTPLDARVFRGADDALMASLKITDSSDVVFSYSVDSGTEASVAIALGSAGLNFNEIETVDVTQTLQAWLDKAADQQNNVATEIRGWLRPGEVALWITGINVYRIQHVRYTLKEKQAKISAGAVTFGGKIYNKATAKSVSSRLIPVGFLISREGESGQVKALSDFATLGIVGILFAANLLTGKKGK